MLKKWKTFLVSGVLALSVLGGTSCQLLATSSPNTEPTGGEVRVIDGKTLMNGFEMFDRDVQLVRMFNEFGRIEQNSDAKYVRSGEKSLKLKPLGSRISTANPFVLLPTFSTRFKEIAFGDFSKVDAVSFWFYNAEETDVNVGIGFGKGAIRMNPDNRRDMINKTNVEYFTLASGWNYVEYNVEPSYLALQGLDIEEVYGIVLEFDYVTSHDMADSPTVYLDDVCLTYVETAKSTAFTMDVKTGKTAEGNTYWSLGDFEDPLEAYYYQYNYGFPAPASAHPVIRTVFAGDYGIMAKSGSQALLIQKKHGGTSYGWPVLRIHEAVVQAVFTKIGDDIKNNPQNYAFKFDLYNASDYTGGWSVEYANANTYSSCSVQPEQWGTYSYSFERVNAAKKADAAAFTEAVGYIEFRWSRYNTEADLSDRPFLLDNVRIEKIA